MAILAELTAEGSIKISSDDGSSIVVYSAAGVYALYENFDASPTCKLMLNLPSRTVELISLRDSPGDGYGNSIFGATTAQAAIDAAALILGGVGGGGGPDPDPDPPPPPVLPGRPIPGETIAIGSSGGSSGSEPPGTDLYGWLSTLAAYSRSLLDRIPQLIGDRIPVNTGLDRGSGVIDEGTLRITTATDDPALDKLTDIDDRLLLTETRSYRRYAEKAFSSASANNAAAVISLPAQGPSGVIVIDEIIACYASAPVQGQVSVTGIQTLGSAPVMNAAHQMPIVAAGPAPLTVRMRGAVNQPVSISLAAGGSGVVAVLWVGWHVEQP
jgi:hypothetical protein